MSGGETHWDNKMAAMQAGKNSFSQPNLSTALTTPPAYAAELFKQAMASGDKHQASPVGGYPSNPQPVGTNPPSDFYENGLFNDFLDNLGKGFSSGLPGSPVSNNTGHTGSQAGNLCGTTDAEAVGKAIARGGVAAGLAAATGAGAPISGVVGAGTTVSDIAIEADYGTTTETGECAIGDGAAESESECGQSEGGGSNGKAGGECN